jgi:hypothetical protein
MNGGEKKLTAKKKGKRKGKGTGKKGVQGEAKEGLWFEKGDWEEKSERGEGLPSHLSECRTRLTLGQSRPADGPVVNNVP